MRTLPRYRLLALLLAAVLLAAACGDDDSAPADTTGSSETTEAATDTTEAATETTEASAAPAEVDVISEGNLTTCTDAPYEPFEFEGDDGEFTGFDMELLRAIAGNLGLELSVTVVPFDGIWLLPAAGECDIVASAMTITPERAESALFSEPYFDADQSLLVRSDDAEAYATLDALGDATIGVQTGTTGELYAQENAPDGASLVSFDEPAALFLALESGDIDAILQDLPVNGFRSTQDDQFVVTDTFPTGEQYGFATSQDNSALIEAVNDELAALRADGTYDAIFATWFGA